MIGLKIIIGIAFILILSFFIVKQLAHIKTVHRLGKLDFVEWYTQNKGEILENIRKKGIKTGFSLEAAIDEEYELYLLH